MSHVIEMRKMADTLDDMNQGDDHDATTERVVTLLHAGADEIDRLRQEIEADVERRRGVSEQFDKWYQENSSLTVKLGEVEQLAESRLAIIEVLGDALLRLRNAES